MHTRVPQELGRSRRLHPKEPEGANRLTKLQAGGWARWHPPEQNARVREVVSAREDNEATEKDTGSLSPFIVPAESRVTNPGGACE